MSLDKTGTHLKYFSQKQDVIVIKNLLASTIHRWEKLLSKCTDQGKQLEIAHKEAKDFHDSWKNLLDWLDENEQSLELESVVGNDSEKIKHQIHKHKEFQKMLGTKQLAFDNVIRKGKALKGKAPKTDIPVIVDMMNQLKCKWSELCSKSVDRQQILEEALLYSGQYKDALQAVLDWLYKVEPNLTEDQPVHGDVDTVNSLCEEHTAFKQELQKRQNQV